MRRRRMSLSEKIFFIDKYYSNGKDWTAVQNDFNREYDVESSQDIEKLIHLVVKRFESTGSVTQDFYFEHGMLFKRESSPAPVRVEEVWLMEEVRPKTEIFESNCPSRMPNLLAEDKPTDKSTTDLIPSEMNKVEKKKTQAKSVREPKAQKGPVPVKETPSVQCLVCSKYFKNKYILTAHIRNIHDRKPRNLVKCPEPGCDVRTRRALVMQHFATHTPLSERDLPACSICSKKLVDVKRHMKMRHPTENQLRHVCEICGKILCDLPTFKLHMLIHTNERPHKCPHCVKAFRNKAGLKYHIRQHTGESPYVCPLCGRAYKRSDHLNVHIKSSHKGSDLN